MAVADIQEGMAELVALGSANDLLYSLRKPRTEY